MKRCKGMVWPPMVLMLALATLMGGCAHDRPVPASSDQTQAYRSTVTPPPGLARVYVLPTYSKGLYADMNGQARISIFPDASSRGVRLASTTRTMFVAFDIAPGLYDLDASGEDGVEHVTKSVEVSAGSTYFLRPVFYRSSQDLPAGSGKAMPGLGFDEVNSDLAWKQIQRMSMAELSAAAQSFLAKTAKVPQQAPIVEPAPAAQPLPPAAQPLPPAAQPLPPATQNAAPNTFQAVEQKLRDLQKLKEEGLITQQDYDERRRSILNAF